MISMSMLWFSVKGSSIKDVHMEMGYYHQSSNRVARWYVFSSVCFFVNVATLEPFEISLRNFYRIWSKVRISSKMAAFQYAVARGLWFNTSRSSFTSEQLWTRGRPNLAVVLTLTLKWLSARFWFRPTWLRLSFHCSHKWNLVSALRRRLTTVLSAPSLKRLSLCNNYDRCVVVRLPTAVH